MTAFPTFSLRHAVDTAPERVAVLAHGRAITYRQLAQDAAEMLTELARAGVGPAVPTAIRAEARYEVIAALHARISAGAPVVPLHTRWSRRETNRLLADDQPIHRLTPTELLKHSPVRAAASGHANQPADVALPTSIPDDDRALAWIATSGTATGRPRWVVLSRAALAAAVAASANNLGWADDDRWLLSLPLAHIGGLSILLRCLSGRATMVIEDLIWNQPEAVLAQLEARAVTLLSMVPTQLARLLTVPGPAPARLRAVLVGGAAAAPALLDEARARGWPVLATYGSTETCSQIATWPLRQPAAEATPTSPAARHHRVPGPSAADLGCGLPLPGSHLRITVDGRIEVSGSALMTGYRPLEGPQPFTADGWLRTNDRGHLDPQGYLHVLGRADDVIVSGGENIDPLQVERALQAHPGILDALVFGASDPTWGQRVCAWLVAHDQPVDQADLLAHLHQHLARFKHPRQIDWVDSLPRTEAGKPDRAAVANHRSGTRLGKPSEKADPIG